MIFIAVESEDEANYLAALLNSTWLNYLVRASNVRGGKSANATNVLETVRVPRFDPRRVIHRRLAALGSQAAFEVLAEAENIALTEHEVDD